MIYVSSMQSSFHCNLLVSVTEARKDAELKEPDTSSLNFNLAWFIFVYTMLD